MSSPAMFGGWTRLWPWPWALAIAFLTGCTTMPRIDWDGRVGAYSYDQAVMDYGPPDKSATLSDGSLVAEWMTRRGSYHVHGYGYGYYGGYPYRPYYHPGYYAAGPGYVTKSPDKHLRLTFDPEGQMREWREVLE